MPDETTVTLPEETTVTTPEETIPDESFTPSQGLAYTVNDDGETCTIMGIGTCADSNVYIGGYIDGYKITTIGEYSFLWRDSLTSVTIGDSVTTIGNYAFWGCSNLASVKIGDSVTTIGMRAFCSASRLTSVIFTNSIGWCCTRDEPATSDTAISASDLSNPTTAAQYLESDFSWYYWHRTE